MRLAERNDLKVSEGQKIARYLDVFKPTIEEKIRVQAVKTLSGKKIWL